MADDVHTSSKGRLATEWAALKSAKHDAQPTITGPVAAIIVTMIVTLGMLWASGSLMPDPKIYATVNYDGGYKKIGVISSEEIFTEAEIALDGETIKSGSFAETIDWMRETSKDGVATTTWKAGVTLNAKAGVEWVGSESNFKLTTDSLSLISTDRNPVSVGEVIKQLEQLQQKAKNERVANSAAALEFGDNPQTSFQLSKLLSFFAK